MKKYLIGCYAPWLTNGIYAVANVGVDEISMYIQMFTLVRAAFFLEQIEMIHFHHKKMNKHSKTAILIIMQIWWLLQVAYGLGS